MHRSDEVIIDGDLETIYRLGSEIENWPRLLPHYRSVEILRHKGDRYMARMHASRSGIPVSWTCLQARDPVKPRIYFHHIGGFTRGMDVAWDFEELADGRVAVRISHEFSKGWRPAAFDRLVSDKIVGEFFVGHIAGKTLNMVKLLAEAERIASGFQHESRATAQESRS